jgi:hypothetical protein
MEHLAERAVELRAAMERHGAPVTLQPAPQLSAGELVARLDIIKDTMRLAMTDGVDYGVIPGTDKPGLFKPGAEKLAVVFRLDVQVANELTWGPGDHLTAIGRATVHEAQTGVRLGCGEGLCTTREKKYATRHANLTCPECGVAAVLESRKEHEPGYFCWRRKGGCGMNFGPAEERITSQTVGEIENPDLPDSWNTVLKMAKKRAYIDAVLSTTSASAIFTQDIGADPTENPARTHGPMVAGEAKQAACAAAVALCGGDVDQGRALWASLNKTLGYVPESVATALVQVAQSTPRPQPGQPQNPESTLAPAASEPGARVKAISRERGLSDARLANLLRAANGQARVEEAQALKELSGLLASIDEAQAQRALELLDLFEPSGDHASSGERERVTSVDFGALDPSQAAA